MVSTAHRVHYTVEEYLAFEEGTDAKHEYLDGQIYAMAGGTPEHAALGAALAVIIGGQLKAGRCRVYSSDLRVRIPQSTLITYPDLSVIGGPVQREPATSSTATNPVLLAEILSASTAEYDRTDKFEHYQQLASLQEYVLVDPSDQTIEVRTRTNEGPWSTQKLGLGDPVELGSIGVRFEVRALFSTAAEPAS